MWAHVAGAHRIRCAGIQHHLNALPSLLLLLPNIQEFGGVLLPLKDMQLSLLPFSRRLLAIPDHLSPLFGELMLQILGNANPNRLVSIAFIPGLLIQLLLSSLNV